MPESEDRPVRQPREFSEFRESAGPEAPDRSRTTDPRTGSDAAAARITHQYTWVDLQIRQAMERGDFDNLPGAGKPIEGLGVEHDPDWWLKQLVDREHIAVLPPALQLRKDDAALDAHLDTLGSEREARICVEDFNARVIRARYTPVDGPPLITMPRDVDATVAAWRDRQAARRRTTSRQAGPGAPPRRRRWWRR